MRDSLQKLGAADIELRVGRSGQFDVTVDGTLKYTRSKTGRFPTDDEVEDLVELGAPLFSSPYAGRIGGRAAQTVSPIPDLN